jgi:DnaJ-class molecular chaperone
MKHQTVTYYDILELPIRASDTDVRNAYYALAKRWHPDLNIENRALAEKQFAAIHKAYLQLRSAPQRQAYNRALLKSLQSKKQAPRSDSRIMFKFMRPYLIMCRDIFWPFVTTPQEIPHG